MKPTHDTGSSTVSSDVFYHGQLPDGREVRALKLALDDGSSVTISEYGCTLLSIRMPDESGTIGETILGFSSLEGYLQDSNYLGALVGRYANRIANGRFMLGGQTIELASNEGDHHLHGGVRGFSHHLWRGEIIDQNGAPALLFQRTSPDGEEGYPGELQCTAMFALRPNHDLEAVLRCETTKPTVVNLTLHPYFNLIGPGSPAMKHRIRINASAFLPVDDGMIPTGEPLPVDGTPFDFRSFHALSERIGLDHPQLIKAGGYDHTFALDSYNGELNEAALVQAPASGRWMRMFTNAPGIQLYSGNSLGQPINGQTSEHDHRSGFCLEPQHWPDSPNKPDFPSAILRPGKEYIHRIHYNFGTGSVD